MRHTWYFGKAAVLVALIFVAANHVTFPVLKTTISDSKFRVAVAASAGGYIPRGQRVTLFIGNSRIMGGIDPVTISDEDRTAYNLAYNGLYLDDLRQLLDAFIRSCDCRVETVVANPDIFRNSQLDHPGISDLQRFFSGLEPAAFKAVQKKDPVYAAAMRLFPLLHLNNEFFLRAFYYSATGKDDQNYSSDYKFIISGQMVRRLQAQPFDAELDGKSIQALGAHLAGAGVRLLVIEPPYHRIFLENVPGLEAAQSEIAGTVAAAGVEYLDHSKLFHDQPELFSDPLHINRAGQRQYSRYILDIIRRQDDS